MNPESSTCSKPSRPDGRGLKLPDPLSEKWSLVTLALAAWLSMLLYSLLLVRPYSLLALIRYPLLDLRMMSQTQPARPYVLLVMFGAQILLYWLGWRAAQRSRGRAAWIIMLWGALMLAADLMLVLPFDAADIFDNIIHGRMTALYHANPFLQVANDFPGDPFLAYSGWRGERAAYGPLWELFAAGVARLSGNGIVTNVFAFKALNGAFWGGCIGLSALHLSRHAPGRALSATLLLAWNPVILYETFAHGHNDIVMAFWIVAAAVLFGRQHFTLGIVALVAGGLIKYLAVLIVPAAVVIACLALPDIRTRLRMLVTSGIAGAALIAAAYAPFWYGIATLGIERRQQMFTTSLPAVIYTLAGSALKAGNGKVITGAALVITLLWCLMVAWWSWRSRWDLATAAFATLTFYILVTCPWFQSWYCVWTLALLPLLRPGYAVGLTQVMGFLTLSKAFIFGPAVLWLNPLPTVEWRELRLGPGVLGPVWLYALLAAVGKWRNIRRSHDLPGREQPLSI